MKQPRLRGVTLATAMLLTAGTSAAAAQEVTLGMITPLTGTNAVAGQDIERGMRLALDRINEGYDVPMKDGEMRSIGPGLLDGEVRVIVEDTESRAAAGMDAARKLVNVDRAPAVIGEYSSGVSVPTGEFTNDNGVVQITPASTSPQLRDIGPYFFSAIGLDDLGGAELARMAVKDSGAERFASIVPNNPFGIGMEISACRTLEEELGGECVAKVRYDLEKTDYRSEINRLFQQDPEAAFYTAYGTESRLILRQAYEMGREPPKGWYADYMTMWSNEVAEIPEAAEGIKGWDVGVSSEFYDEEYAGPYEEAYGERPTTSFGPYAYDSMMLLALAIDEAGSAEADAIRDALPELAKDYQGVTGDKTFDEDGMQVDENYQYMIYKGGGLEDYAFEQ